MKYYDVTFHGLTGRTVVKRTMPSAKDPFEAWQDACVKVTETELCVLVNEGYVIINRKFLARIDVEEVKDPIEEAQKRKDEVTNVINTLSNMGF